MKDFLDGMVGLSKTIVIAITVVIVTIIFGIGSLFGIALSC